MAEEEKDENIEEQENKKCKSEQIIDIRQLLKQKFYKVMLIDISTSMNLEDQTLNGEEISRLDYLKKSKIDELELDVLSTGWFIYQFNEKFATVYETDPNNENWKKECAEAINNMEAVGQTDMCLGVQGTNNAIRRLMADGIIEDGSNVTVYFLSDNEDDEYDPSSVGIDSKDRDLLFQDKNIKRYIRYWELLADSKHLQVAINFDPKIDVNYNSLEDEKKDAIATQNVLVKGMNIIASESIQDIAQQQEQCAELIQKTMEAEKQKTEKMNEASNQLEQLSTVESDDGKKVDKKEEAAKLENIGTNINNITNEASKTMNDSNDQTYGELMNIMNNQKKMIQTSRSKKFKKQKEKLQSDFNDANADYGGLKDQNKALVGDIMGQVTEKMNLLNEDRGKSAFTDFINTVATKLTTLSEYAKFCKDLKRNITKLYKEALKKKMDTSELEKKLNDSESNFKNTLQRSNNTLNNIFQTLARMEKICQTFDPEEKVKLKENLKGLKLTYEEVFGNEGDGGEENNVIKQINRLLQS